MSDATENIGHFGAHKRCRRSLHHRTCAKCAATLAGADFPWLDKIFALISQWWITGGGQPARDRRLSSRHCGDSCSSSRHMRAAMSRRPCIQKRLRARDFISKAPRSDMKKCAALLSTGRNEDRRKTNSSSDLSGTGVLACDARSQHNAAIERANAQESFGMQQRRSLFWRSPRRRQLDWSSRPLQRSQGGPRRAGVPLNCLKCLCH